MFTFRIVRFPSDLFDKYLVTTSGRNNPEQPAQGKRERQEAGSGVRSSPRLVRPLAIRGIAFGTGNLLLEIERAFF